MKTDFELSRRGFLRAAILGGAIAAGAAMGSRALASEGAASSAADTSAVADGVTERTVTDDAGREVTIPTDIERVYCAIPTAEAAVVGLCPEKLVGWVNELSDEDAKYMPECTRDLPVLGGWMGQVATANMESIINADPDIILYCYGTDAGSTDTSSYASAADQIQSDAGKPVFVFKGNLELIPEKYRLLGDILGVQDRAEELATYAEEKLKAVKDAVSQVPSDEVVTCYYAEGEGGLATDPSGSMHTEVIDYCNVDNVAQVDGFMGAKGQGMIEVSMESVIGWNPQMILVSGMTPANYDTILTEDSWSDIDAVKNGKVYQSPTIPFGWFDRPPNMMRIMGIQWFANLVYPDYYDADIREDMKEYFKLFYNVEITDEDVDAIIAPNPTLA